MPTTTKINSRSIFEELVIKELQIQDTVFMNNYYRIICKLFTYTLLSPVNAK